VKSGWYRVDESNLFRYWDEDFTDFQGEARKLGVSQKVTFLVGPKSFPRAKSVRILFVVAGLFVLNVAVLGISLLSDEISTNIDGISRIVVLSLMMYLSTKVGYRWFDGLLSAVPFYGVFYIGRTLWRASVLPHRYWTIRDEEIGFEPTQIINATRAEALNSNTLELNSNKRSLEEGDSVSELAGEGKNSRVWKEFKFAVIASVSVLVLISFTLFWTNSNRIGIFNYFECRNLKQELVKQDVIGRQLWNAYQLEVSNLNNFEMYSNQYYIQVENVARRVLQVWDSDRIGYEKILEKPYCAQNPSDVTSRLATVKVDTLYLLGQTERGGKKCTPYNGWNTSYYAVYQDFGFLLKQN
jgi:hypothetical protein